MNGILILCGLVVVGLTIGYLLTRNKKESTPVKEPEAVVTEPPPPDDWVVEYGEWGMYWFCHCGYNTPWGEHPTACPKCGHLTAWERAAGREVAVVSPERRKRIMRMVRYGVGRDFSGSYTKDNHIERWIEADCTLPVQP